MTVYIVESGDYEQRGVDLVADSMDAAARAIQRRYSSPPYVVEWKPVLVVDGIGTLVGEFADVPGWSVGHTGVFEITAYELQTAYTPAHA